MSVTVTVIEAVQALLSGANWSLAPPLAAANIHFDHGWLDRQWIGFSDPAPQIIVSGPIVSPIRFFGPRTSASLGHHLLSYGRYVINIWIRIMAGTDGDLEEDYMELLRVEVVRILNEKGCTVLVPAALSMVFPLDYGRALHELNQVPRVLRYEIAFQANWQT